MGKNEQDALKNIPKIFVTDNTNPWTKMTTVKTLPYPKSLQSEILVGQNSKLLLAKGMYQIITIPKGFQIRED